MIPKQKSRTRRRQRAARRARELLEKRDRVFVTKTGFTLSRGLTAALSKMFGAAPYLRLRGVARAATKNRRRQNQVNRSGTYTMSEAFR